MPIIDIAGKNHFVNEEELKQAPSELKLVHCSQCTMDNDEDTYHTALIQKTKKWIESLTIIKEGDTVFLEGLECTGEHFGIVGPMEEIQANKTELEVLAIHKAEIEYAKVEDPEGYRWNVCLSDLKSTTIKTKPPHINRPAIIIKGVHDNEDRCRWRIIREGEPRDYETGPEERLNDIYNTGRWIRDGIRSGKWLYQFRRIGVEND